MKFSASVTQKIITTSLLVFLFIAFIGFSCDTNRKEREHSSDNPSGNAAGESANLQDFTSGEFGFSVKYPENWVQKTFQEGRHTIINFLPADQENQAELPVIVHAKPGISFVGIYPAGYEVDLPFGKSSRILSDEISVPFPVNLKQSRKFLLENGEPWGYYIVPARIPESWSNYGFIFAQIAVNNPRIQCIDKETGKEVEMPECDPMKGDTVKRFGEVASGDKTRVRELLKKTEFQQPAQNTQHRNNVDSEGIQISQPKPGSKITSPLEIKGEAKGTWFFEATFEVELLKNGDLLADTFVRARSDWMTEDFVPFSAILIFQPEEAGNAILKFKNSNPSGLPEHSKTYSLPVTIGN